MTDDIFSDDYDWMRTAAASDVGRDILDTLDGSDEMTADATAHDRSTIDSHLRELRRCALTRQTKEPDNPAPAHDLSPLGEVIVKRGVEDGIEALQE